MNERAPEQWVPAILYRNDRERIECTLCPHRCRLSDGQVGLCRVRRRRGDVLETATFSGIAVSHEDPIERKPLYHFRPGTTALTIAAPGCTFFCSYCINYRLSQFGRPAGSPWSGGYTEVMDVVHRAAQIDGIVALSYTEPALACELTLELARAKGLSVVWKSNGFLTQEAVQAVAPALAAANIDLKAATEEQHRRLTGAALKPVIDTIRALHDRGVWLEVSTPLIPAVNDNESDLTWMARTLANIGSEIPWHLLRFTPTFRMADRDPTTPAALARASEIGRAAGLRFVYVERALGQAGRTTYCPSCGEAAIVRGLWRTETNRLVDGACPGCTQAIDGRW